MYPYVASRDSSVGILTRYGLGPMIESRWGSRFSSPLQTGFETHSTSYKMGTASFPAVNRPGHGFDHPPHLASRLKKDSSCDSTPPWAFVDCSRVTYTFTLPLCILTSVLKLYFHFSYMPSWLLKVNQSHYRPEVPKGFQEVKAPRFRDNGPGWW